MELVQLLVEFPYGAVVKLYEFPKVALDDGVAELYETEVATEE